MGGQEVSTKRTTEETNNYKKIKEITKWLSDNYRRELDSIERANYLGYAYPKTKRDLLLEAYAMEQELRRLKGLEPLGKIKFIEFI